MQFLEVEKGLRWFKVELGFFQGTFFFSGVGVPRSCVVLKTRTETLAETEPAHRPHTSSKLRAGFGREVQLEATSISAVVVSAERDGAEQVKCTRAQEQAGVFCFAVTQLTQPVRQSPRQDFRGPPILLLYGCREGGGNKERGLQKPGPTRPAGSSNRVASKPRPDALHLEREARRHQLELALLLAADRGDDLHGVCGGNPSTGPGRSVRSGRYRISAAIQSH